MPQATDLLYTTDGAGGALDRMRLLDLFERFVVQVRIAMDAGDRTRDRSGRPNVTRTRQAR